MIESEHEMDDEERMAVILVHLALNDLVFSHPKVLSRRVAPWEAPPPEDMLTPQKVRELVRQHTGGLGRGVLVERYLLERLKINGAAFLAWERDPTVIVGYEGPAP